MENFPTLRRSVVLTWFDYWWLISSVTGFLPSQTLVFFFFLLGRQQNIVSGLQGWGAQGVFVSHNYLRSCPCLVERPRNTVNQSVPDFTRPKTRNTKIWDFYLLVCCFHQVPFATKSSIHSPVLVAWQTVRCSERSSNDHTLTPQTVTQTTIHARGSQKFLSRIFSPCPSMFFQYSYGCHQHCLMSTVGWQLWLRQSSLKELINISSTQRETVFSNGSLSFPVIIHARDGVC